MKVTEPDKVNDVAPAKAPVPLKATPESPVTVMIGLPPFPAKVMVPVVGADKVTVEVDAVAVVVLSAKANVKTMIVRIALRILGTPVEVSKECGWDNPPWTKLLEPSTATMAVNSTQVPEL